MEPNYQHLYEILANSQGYIFPNEIDLQWGILIVVYPFITGLVAGAFILASLERVFKDKDTQTHLPDCSSDSTLISAGCYIAAHKSSFPAAEGI